jgi:hypothetical protein
MAEFGVSSVEHSGSATRDLVNSKMVRREIGCEDGKWLRIC